MSSDAVRDALLRVKALTADRSASSASRSSRAAELLETLKLTNPKVGSALSSALTSDRVVALNKPAVILKIGCMYTQCGFAGELMPRHTIKTPHGIDRTNVKTVVRDLLHTIFYQLLLTNPKERRFVISEAFVETEYIRSELHRALLVDFGVVSISPLPGPALALLPIGLSSGLMIDLGYEELRILPVYCGMPIVNAFRALSLGAKSNLSRLRKLLDSASVVTSTNGRMPVSACDLGDILTEAVLEDILVRSCLVTADDVDKGDLPYKLTDGQILLIDGSLRQSALGQIFNDGDEDNKTLPSAILDAVLASPIDVRTELLSHMVVYGGLAHAKGISARLVKELDQLLHMSDTPKYSSIRQLKASIVQFPFQTIKAQSLEWTGASLFGSFDILSANSLSKDDQATASDWRRAWSGL